MKPPKHELPFCCPGTGTHVRRFLPVPENEAEQALIAAYDDNCVLGVDADIAEAVQRFMQDGATADNLAWAEQTRERELERL